MLDYSKNFTIGFFTGYLFAVMFTYLQQLVASGFSFANFDVQVILAGVLFGWIVGIINGVFCIKQVNISRISIGLITGTILFYLGIVYI